MSKQTLSSFCQTQAIPNLQRELPQKNYSTLRAKVQNDLGKSKNTRKMNSLTALNQNQKFY